MNPIEALRQALGETVTLRDASEHDAIDGVLPRVVAAPRDEESAQKLVAWCGQNDLAFIARGGGTKIHIGAKPARCDLIISTENLNQIIEHDEGNATVEAGAGVALDNLNAEVSRRSQFVPLDWREDSGATLGGVVASNHFGSTKLRYGAPRDLVVGLHAILSDGRVVKAGSKVVKNVSGYDLNKIFIGSFGTLGLITRVTLRLRPDDAARRAWTSTPASWEEAEKRAREISEGAFEPALLRVIYERSTLHLSARFDGSAAAIDSQMARLPESAGDPAMDEPHSENCALQLRAVLPLARAANWAQAAQQMGAPRVLWECGLGVVRAQFESAACGACGGGIVAQLRAQAHSNDGFVLVENAPHQLKTPDFVWGAPRSDFPLQRELKKKFDGGNVCAPGRFIGGL
jgi:glycolate oxidase FAD binding subunit